MKTFSRYISVLLILIMILSLSVSCKKSGEDGEDAVAETSDGSGSSTEGGTDSTGAGAGGKTDDTGTTGSTGTSKNQGGVGDKKESQGGKATGTVTTKDGYTEDSTGKVISTKTENEVDDQYRIKAPVSNQNAFVPDEEQGLEKSARRATEASKYDFDKNPLINRDRQQNKTYMPSFAVDDTGFVKAGTKLADLKGKTLAFFTSDNFAAWSYRNAKGETIDEWTWFKQLKTELGLNIKYTKKQHMDSINSALQYMNAGKQCDIIYSNHVIFPASICVTRSITELVNINNLGSSPGICKRTMDICKWGNTLRLIAPIGCVDVLWYNQTLAQELNLSDPHTMWEKGVWSWETFKNFLYSAPKTTKDGKKLMTFVEWNSNASYIWPSTNGAPRTYIDANADTPQLINNWDNPQTIAAWEFITTVCNNVNFDDKYYDNHIGMYLGTTLMSATMYTQVYRDTEYSKKVQINWVPYPRADTPTGQEICQYYGFGMMLPRKTSKPENVDAALKFMELWATRFTETLFDNLNTFEYYNFNYKQRKQYFDFVTSNVVFALAMNDLSGSGITTETKFFDCFTGNAAYNVKTEAAKGSNLMKAYIYDSLKFGQ